MARNRAPHSGRQPISDNPLVGLSICIKESASLSKQAFQPDD
jgi:hypothetical protein